MKKLKLNELKVKSFVTNLSAINEGTIQGGKKVPTGGDCDAPTLWCPAYTEEIQCVTGPVKCL